LKLQFLEVEFVPGDLTSKLSSTAAKN